MASNYRIKGNQVFSYETCIVDKLPNGQTIGNVTHYSVTTSRHQKVAEVKKCDILLDNVPRGENDLVYLYQLRNS